MEFERQHRFAYPAADVWAMFHDPTSHIDKFTEMDHIGVEVVSKKKSKKKLEIVITRDVEVEGIPGFAKKFIHPQNTVVSTDTWIDNGDGTYGGHFELDIHGVPVHTNGITALVPIDETSSLYTVKIEINVNVPLVGGKIADFSKTFASDQLEEEFAISDRWLAERA